MRRAQGDGIRIRGYGHRTSTQPILWLVASLLIPSVWTVPTALAEPEQGYTVSAEANADSLGLALPDGTWQIWLGDGCSQLEAGDNVLVDGPNDTTELRIIDPLLGVQDQVCQVTRRLKRDDRPCATNPDGVCDVAWVR